MAAPKPVEIRAVFAASAAAIVSAEAVVAATAAALQAIISCGIAVVAIEVSYVKNIEAAILPLSIALVPAIIAENIKVNPEVNCDTLVDIDF
jgi:hypothetical protein